MKERFARYLVLIAVLSLSLSRGANAERNECGANAESNAERKNRDKEAINAEQNERKTCAVKTNRYEDIQGTTSTCPVKTNRYEDTPTCAVKTNRYEDIVAVIADLRCEDEKIREKLCTSPLSLCAINSKQVQGCRTTVRLKHNV
jgi:hypothetical protein